MKKLFLLLFATSLPFVLFADDTGVEEVTVDGVFYYVEHYSKLAYVQGPYYEGQEYKGDVKIRNSVNGCRVVEIGSGAFRNSKKLTSVQISSSVETIGAKAFDGCSGIAEIYIPSSVTSIDYGIFAGCSNLVNLTVATFNKEYDSRDNCNAIIATKTNTLIAGCKNSVIPNDITIIWKNAFERCNGLEAITLPENVSSIREMAFSECKDLKEFTCLNVTPPSVKDNTFDKTDIGSIVLYVPAKSIEQYKTTAPWKNFKEIVAIPGTEVKTYKLTYTVDGETYKTIEINEGDAVTPEEEPTKDGYTFSGWKDLPETMPGQDVVVTGSFTVNSYTLTYYLDGEEYKTYSVEYGSSINSENAPDKEGHTFSGWGDVPQTMPAGDVTLYGTYTANTYKLIFMVDGEVYKTIDVKYGDKLPEEAEPTKDGYTFSGWSWMPSKMPAEDVVVSGSFTKVSYEVMGGTYQIEDGTAVLLNANNESGDIVIDDMVIINNTYYFVTTIGEGAFEGRNDITSVKIPNSVKSIYANAFNGCTGLDKIILGKGVEYIGTKAFAYIGQNTGARNRAGSSPLVVECYAESVPDAQYDSFEGTDMKNVVLKVDDNLVDSYKKVYPWNQFTNIVGFNASTGFNSIYSEKNGDSIFSIDGRRIDKPQKGMNIIRTSKGVMKVLTK